MSKFRKIGTFLILLSVVMIICTSCSRKNGSILSKTPDLNLPYETNMKICAGKLELEASVKRYGMGMWDMTVNSPETLAGLKLSYNDDGINAMLDGLEFKIPMEDINEKAVFALIFKALDNAATTDKLVCNEADDGKIFSGDFSYGSYSIVFEPESLIPIGLEIPAAELSCKIENFHTLTGKSEEGSETGNVTETSPANN